MNTFDSRNEIRQLLPWFENGTLRADERDAVRALLATDLEGNRQRRELRVLREVLANDATLATNMALNLGRLQGRLGPSRIAVRLTTRWLAAAALMVLAVGATTFFAGVRLGSYHTLTAPATAESVPADAELIRVDVVAGVDAEALVRLAGDPQVRVLHGPSEHGVATLAVPRAHAQQITARLSADPRLRFVAPVPR